MFVAAAGALTTSWTQVFFYPEGYHLDSVVSIARAGGATTWGGSQPRKMREVARPTTAKARKAASSAILRSFKLEPLDMTLQPACVISGLNLLCG
jgi:hypothetical protein